MAGFELIFICAGLALLGTSIWIVIKFQGGDKRKGEHLIQCLLWAPFIIIISPFIIIFVAFFAINLLLKAKNGMDMRTMSGYPYEKMTWVQLVRYFWTGKGRKHDQLR